MARFRVFGLAFLVVFAFGAGAAASASAASPEYVLETGAFPVGFTWTSGAGTYETTAGETLTCRSGGTGVGGILNSKEGEATLALHGCSTTFFGFPVACRTPGKAPEEIQTKLLGSHLYYNVGKTKVVDDLSPASGTTFAEYECGGNTVVWTGSLIGVYPTTNEFLHETELVLKQTKGVQEITEYETESGTKVSAFLKASKNGGTSVQMGVTTTDKITLEGVRKVKIRS
jgi:hypothetical protein